MAIQLTGLPFAGELTIENDLGVLSSKLGGVTSQWDLGRGTLSSYNVQMYTTNKDAKDLIEYFLRTQGVQEEIDISIDSRVYRGVFTGKFQITLDGSLYAIQSGFVGKETS